MSNHRIQITEQRLREIIKEELENIDKEPRFFTQTRDKIISRGPGALLESPKETEQKKYPIKSKMKTLILQAKRAKNPSKRVYKQTYNPDLEQLKKDYDEFVRDTPRDTDKEYTSTKGDGNE